MVAAGVQRSREDSFWDQGRTSQPRAARAGAGVVQMKWENPMDCLRRSGWCPRSV